MHNFLSNIHINVNEQLYLKDPESSLLGRNIIQGSITLIHSLGFEDFTFRKLAKTISSTEASIYRYFESKHKVLLFLSSWYWAWMEYSLVFKTANIPSKTEQLKRAIKVLTGSPQSENSTEHINLTQLHEIVICESSKSYFTKLVDQENKVGAFKPYKEVVGRVSELISQINPDYKYPHMLISTVIEGAHHQRFFADHLPRLTDVVQGEDTINAFYTDLVFKSIKQ